MRAENERAEAHDVSWLCAALATVMEHSESEGYDEKADIWSFGRGKENNSFHAR